jgi:gamma-glutamyltranspeptidase/glutathione hydrolase
LEEDDLRKAPLVVAGLVAASAVAAQTVVPGDRPAGNVRGTRSAPAARHGMIATSQALASAAGLRVLQQGGNAIDAAVTAAAVIAVVEPGMNGAGGDLFAIVYDAKTKKVYGLDSSGRSPRRATPEEYARRGLKEVPLEGPLAVDVPGAVAGWSELLARFGTIPLGKALEPAIGYAREGFPVQEIMAADWEEAVPRLRRDPAAAKTFLVDAGRAPRAGEIFRNENLAQSLEAIARDGRDAFYKGAIARKIAADMQARGGLLELSDLEAHRSEWVEPIRTTYRGVELLEMPPSNQGFVALEMLNIMEGFDVRSMGHNSADYLHLVAEAKKIAFADRARVLADRDFVPKGTIERLTSKEYAAERRKDVDMKKAAAIAALDFAGRDLGDTIYMTAADGQGNVVSLIQSLFDSFGAGIVAGDTGIALHNRGAGFVLTPGHPNQIGPGKRPLHTLVPAMLLKDGKPWVSFGVMGGDNQAQAHAQVVANLVDFGMNVRDAGDAARVRHIGTALGVESGVPESVRAELQARGHRLVDGIGMMGGYQAVLIDPRSGVLFGGSDLRKDGLAIGF